MQISLSSVRPGDLVVVRRHRWRVREVHAYEDCAILTLVGAAAANWQAVSRVLTPFDLVEPVAAPVSRRPRVVGPRRWRRALRTLLADAVPPGGLRAARDARADLLPHQLEPALAVIRGLGSRLLLADEVGLGKTIQAGLVAAELTARGMAERCLILTPAGLRDQWAQELRTRFHIDAQVADAAGMRVRLATLPLGVNPWATMPITIASIDYVKRPETLPAVSSCRWDLVIVDEAHGAADRSDRHAAVAALAARALWVVLVTATPHNGDPAAFHSLCGLGARRDGLLAFRRTRDAIRLDARRRIHRLHVGPNAAEARMHALLAAFTRAVRADNGDGRAVWLALSVLHKRAFSSAQSLELSVGRRLRALADPADAAPQLGLPLDDGESDPGDEPPEWNAGLALRDPRRERRLLTALAAAAHAAAAQETKIAALARLLRRLGEPAIVFTEFRDTLEHLHAALRHSTSALHGGLSRSDRARVVERFVRGADPVLLATDTAGEGLNLHQACRSVINLELPWNPVRLEQRIGRVDRIGQRRTVHAFHLIARGTGEDRILERLRTRIARARHDFAAADPVGDEVAAARWAIGGAARPAPDAAEAGTPADPPIGAGLEFPDLASEAALEVRRLQRARRWLRPDRGAPADVPTLDRPLMTTVRHRLTRVRLGGRLLLLLACQEDAGGHPAAWTVVGITVDVHQSLALDAQTLESILRGVRAGVEAAAVRAATASRDAAGRMHAALMRTARTRERLIVGPVAALAADLFQPGLFDRRADRRHLEARLTVEAAIRDAQNRQAALERMADLESRPPELRLVLVPR